MLSDLSICAPLREKRGCFICNLVLIHVSAYDVTVGASD